LPTSNETLSRTEHLKKKTKSIQKQTVKNPSTSQEHQKVKSIHNCEKLPKGALS
jgi:CRISPR/Cas system CSM-associated protein Csm4 (group 5 of RAMP superfamily)